MTILEIFLTAVSLSLDAASVALAAGAMHAVTHRQALKIALYFGGFQALMPLLGWAFAMPFRALLVHYGHIVGFVLLLIVGLNMGKEALSRETDEEVDQERHLAETKVLLLMAIATSIDAMVVGITFNVVPVNVPLAASIIGIVTFVAALLAVYVGERSKHLIGKKIEVVGALILIALAFKILLGK